MAAQKQKENLRSFGLIVAAGFSVIGILPMVFRGQSPRLWPLAVAAVTFALALIHAPILKPAFKVWMAVGEVLGWVNTRIILTLLFYAVIVPIGMLLRLARKDPMQRKFDPAASTYRIPRTKRPPSHMQHQF